MVEVETHLNHAVQVGPLDRRTRAPGGTGGQRQLQRRGGLAVGGEHQQAAGHGRGVLVRRHDVDMVAVLVRRHDVDMVAVAEPFELLDQAIGVEDVQCLDEPALDDRLAAEGQHLLQIAPGPEPSGSPGSTCSRGMIETCPVPGFGVIVIRRRSPWAAKPMRQKGEIS